MLGQPGWLSALWYDLAGRLTSGISRRHLQPNELAYTRIHSVLRLLAVGEYLIQRPRRAPCRAATKPRTMKPKPSRKRAAQLPLSKAIPNDPNSSTRKSAKHHGRHPHPCCSRLWILLVCNGTDRRDRPHPG